MDRGLRRATVNILRYIIGSLFIILGKPRLDRHVTSFVFHEVSNTPRAHARQTHTYSDVNTFEKQIGWIQGTFEVRNLQSNFREQGGRECIVTFDDGYLGLIEHALPILEGKGIPAVCFINMATINGELNSSALAMYVANREKLPIDWADSNPRFYSQVLENLTSTDLQMIREYQGPFLNGQQLERISNSPLITIGDHLYNHWLLEALTEDEIRSELAKSAKELGALKAYKQIFAAPHGVASLTVLNILLEGGFRSVFSGRGSYSLGAMTIYPRIDLNNDIANVQQFFGAIVISKLRASLGGKFGVSL